MSHKAEAEYVAVEKSEPLRAECGHFLDCLKTGRRQLLTAGKARVLQVLALAQQSLENKPLMRLQGHPLKGLCQVSCSNRVTN